MGNRAWCKDWRFIMIVPDKYAKQQNQDRIILDEDLAILDYHKSTAKEKRVIDTLERLQYLLIVKYHERWYV